MRYLIIITLLSFYLFAKTPKDVIGCCGCANGKDYKKKTYSDSDGDGKYDHVTTVDCAGDVTTEPYTEKSSLIGNPEVGNFEHILVEDDNDPSKGGRKIVWHLVDKNTNVIEYIEFKDYTDQSLTLDNYVIPPPSGN